MRYVLPCAIVGLATILRLALNPFIADRFPFAFFFFAVLMATWLGGVGPGVVALVLGGIVADLLYLPPTGSISMSESSAIVGLAVYCLVSAFVIAVVARYRSANAERKAAEQRLQMGLEAANAATWDVDLASGKIHWSTTHYRLLGYRVGEVHPSFEAWQARVHPDDAPAVSQRWREFVAGRGRFACEYRIALPDGVERWVDTKAMLIRDDSGKPVRAVGGFVDITERKQSQQALIEAERRAATGDMAATLAHEINNPLAAITNLVYLIKMDPELRGVTRQYIDLADDEVLRVSALVRKTLSFYRSQSQPVPASISDLLQQVADLYRDRIEKSNVTLDLRLNRADTILCQPNEVRQILSNLFLNAVEAAGAGGSLVVRSAVARALSDEGRHGVRITFADTGPGIPAENRDRIFQPFFSTKGERGTGLGLWICKGLVEKNGGSIRFRTRTQAPSGTCVTVFIPDATSSPHAIAAP